ncbi:hypothetical protein AYI68_g3050 [Smittium mucronatum]|uniref:tRNA(Ile)-lysidine/2-thiocytidine synthase N-terminal domain-containing protein n=1 Tax=Smittium mucronatum TaxID=133383 RepID=A0A1R0H121_9FUNG|nr:hypothetical protein AYI68_g3050 [Smittium mucronatum]
MLSKFNQLVKRYDFDGLRYAVSGGVDSMALSYLASKSTISERISTLIIDHSLRPESSDDTIKTVHNLSNLGLDTTVCRIIWKDHSVTNKNKPFDPKKHESNYSFSADLQNKSPFSLKNITYFSSSFKPETGSKLEEIARSERYAIIERYCLENKIDRTIPPTFSSVSTHSFNAKRLIRYKLEKVSIINKNGFYCWDPALAESEFFGNNSSKTILMMCLSWVVKAVSYSKHPPKLSSTSLFAQYLQDTGKSKSSICHSGVILRRPTKKSPFWEFSKQQLPVSELISMKSSENISLGTSTIWNNSYLITVRQNLETDVNYSYTLVSLANILMLHMLSKFDIENPHYNFEYNISSKINKESLIHHWKTNFLPSLSKSGFRF